MSAPTPSAPATAPLSAIGAASQPALFHNPVATVFGNGCLDQLPQLCTGQVALVTFPEAAPLGLIDRVRALLGDRLRHVIADVQPNPDVAWLREVHPRFWQVAGECTTVVALGGGSVIDTAKALIVGTASGRFDELLELLAAGQPFVPARHKRLIAAPTTAGTGSEVTPWATLWDAQQLRKYSLHLDCTWPERALIDPELMLSVPAGVTLSTGLDALSHALLEIPRLSYNTRGMVDDKKHHGALFRFRVFHRAGKKCERCGGIIEKTTLSSRPFYWCPGCQR